MSSKQERIIKSSFGKILKWISIIIYFSFFFILGIFFFNASISIITQRPAAIIERRQHRILCYVNTIPATYFTKAIHIKNTWGRRCSKILFLSSKEEPTIPIIDLNLTKPESRMHLWSKMRKILRYVYAYRNEYDYFFKCDDDTYLFYENLADELSRRNPNDSFMMGHRFLKFSKSGYFSGGAGYLLSREALVRIVEDAIDKHPKCPTYDEDKEDVKMSICGSAVGVKMYDAIDEYEKNKFQWLEPESFFKRLNWILPKERKNPTKMLRRLPISVNQISFHYAKAEILYLIDYFVYFAKIFPQP